MRRWLTSLTAPLASPMEAELASRALRMRIKKQAGVPHAIYMHESEQELLSELSYLITHSEDVAKAMRSHRSNRLLCAGQAYYNLRYLTLALRKRGWKAELLNWDSPTENQKYYHGEDYYFSPPTENSPYDGLRDLRFYVAAIYSYDIFHFSNMHGICFSFYVQSIIETHFSKYAEIRLLKSLGKKIVYTNNGCFDGVSPTSFSSWGPESVCSTCRWHNNPKVCSDEKNLAWGTFRNEVADFQCLLGGNRIDCNLTPTAHEVPEVLCLEPSIWNPDLAIPEAFTLPPVADGTVRLYHAVGRMKERTDTEGINIKSTHVYLPLIDKLKSEGFAVELIEASGIPNIDVRFIQMQADIFLEMLTYGWFGANAREAMMLGKPVICFIRPEWLESVRKELPEYAAELPIVSATPHTVESVLKDLILNPAKRAEIGARSRAFALKWHSSEAAANRFEYIYSELLRDNPMLCSHYA